MLTGDLSVLFADFGLAASWMPPGATVPLASNVILDAPDQTILSGALQSREYAMTYISTDFPGLAYGNAVTVDGTDYEVRAVAAEHDGKLSIATLSKK
jgi:hypothetical protein